MNALGFYTLVFYGLISILVVFFLPLRYRKSGILFLSLLILSYTIGVEGSLLLVFLFLLFYGIPHLLSLAENRILLPLAIVLTPMLIAKLFLKEDHFALQLNQSGRTLALPEWYKFFKILGLSYFCFNGLSYWFDIKSRQIKAETSIVNLAFYLFYLPSFAAGPLNRYARFNRLTNKLELNESNLILGLRLILWGAFKNFVVAFRLKLLLSAMEQAVTGAYTPLLGLIFFLYLYVSFSSYVNIAQGFSLLINVRLPENFQSRIYLSSNRHHYWKGWHMTLNDWFRDYFLMRLLRFNTSQAYIYIALFLTFLLTALWHDFTMVFFIWGSLNAAWILIEKRFKLNIYFSVHKLLGTCIHLSFSAFLATIFITPSLEALTEIIREFPYSAFIYKAISLSTLFLAGLSFGIMDSIEHKCNQTTIDQYLNSLSTHKRWFIYFVLINALLFLGKIGQIENYYYQF